MPPQMGTGQFSFLWLQVPRLSCAEGRISGVWRDPSQRLPSSHCALSVPPANPTTQPSQQPGVYSLQVNSRIVVPDVVV